MKPEITFKEKDIREGLLIIGQAKGMQFQYNIIIPEYQLQMSIIDRQDTINLHKEKIRIEINEYINGVEESNHVLKVL